MLSKFALSKYKLLFWAIFAGVVVAAYSLAPQFQLWALRGHDWTGVYAIHDFDEPQYAAYIQSLIDGKPRRNYPYIGVVETPEKPLKESFFSIQFCAFYPIAIPARLLGMNSSAAMIAFNAVVGFLAGLALFWLFFILFDGAFMAFVGTVAVYSCGMLIAGQGSLINWISPESIYYTIAFPFARRAVPGIGFPALFLFFGFVWKFVSAQTRRTRIYSVGGAFFSFAFLVYSYFYLWTAAAGWLGGLILLWLIFRFEDWRKTTVPLAAAGLLFCTALVPYFILMANRSTAMDSVLLLEFTRRPDLFRLPEIIGFAVLATFAAAHFFGWISWREPKIVFLMSFALVAPIVFNQQILTGRSLQPVHYQFYSANYIAGFAAVSLIFVLLLKKAPIRAVGKILFLVGLIAFYNGYSDGQKSVKSGRGVNDWRNDLMPVAGKIKYISAQAGKTGTILSFDFTPFTVKNSDELPALSSQAVVWSLHQEAGSDLTPEENHLRLFKFVYYQNLSEDWLKAELLKGKSDLATGFFGWGRSFDVFTENANPITEAEVDKAVNNYRRFRENFNFTDAQSPLLSFVIAHEMSENDYTALDEWYERDAGEKVGKYILYRVELKNP
ncbi:MAG TPA: hypothetical protein VNI84_18085 [Pyrinomonadaceae bacterium]|nr:hypothetical protein [Pyrinomonadaceae bacterium]